MRPRPLGSGLVRAPQRAGADESKEKLSFSFALLLAWIALEYGRPANPMGIPLLISSLLLIGWLLNKDKRWSRQSVLLVVFLGVMAIGVPLAENTFAAFWALYAMATIVLCICLPLPSLVNSTRAVRVFIYTFVGVSFYVGAWANVDGGFGPAGAGGGQDENYVSAMMGMAIPLAYFSIFAARRGVVKVFLTASIVVFIGAMVAAQNVSRGGFIGLCAVFLYCLARSPRRLTGFVVIALVIAIVLPFVGPGYWDEIMTIRDVNEGTADMRLEIWEIGLRMWQANPILGVGAGNFRWVVGDYQSVEQLEKFGRGLGGSIIAHSLFVELLAELGAVGVLVVLVLLRRTAGDLWRVVRNGRARPGPSAPDDNAASLRCYADGVTGAIIACLVNGMFLSLLYYSYLWILVMLGSAIWQVSAAHVRMPAVAASSKRPPGHPYRRERGA